MQDTGDPYFEDSSVACPASERGAVKAAIRAQQQRAWAAAIRSTRERNEVRKRPIWSHLKYRTLIVRPTRTGGSVETVVCPLHQSERVFSISLVERDQRGKHDAAVRARP